VYTVCPVEPLVTNTCSAESKIGRKHKLLAVQEKLLIIIKILAAT
jgi:hypothetical protein